MTFESLEVPDGWRELVARLKGDTRGVSCRRRVYLLGATDSGKSTLCRYLLQELGNGHKMGAAGGWLDCDPGQGSLGPPTTIGLAIGPAGDVEGRVRRRFVGSTTPVGHLLQTVVGAKRLIEAAEKDLPGNQGLPWLVMDSPGLVEGSTGREFQHQSIDLLTPDWVVALGNDEVLAPVLSVFEARGIPEVVRLKVCASVVPRTARQRRTHRQRRFCEYFQTAKECELTLAGRGLHGRVPEGQEAEDVGGRVVALCDRQGEVVVLALVSSMDWARGCLRMLAPPFEPTRVVSVQFGTLRLTRTGQEL